MTRLDSWRGLHMVITTFGIFRMIWARVVFSRTLGLRPWPSEAQRIVRACPRLRTARGRLYGMNLKRVTPIDYNILLTLRQRPWSNDLAQEP